MVLLRGFHLRIASSKSPNMSVAEATIQFRLAGLSSVLIGVKERYQYIRKTRVDEFRLLDKPSDWCVFVLKGYSFLKL